MSDQVRHGLGYGYQITEPVETYAEQNNIDIWDVVEDDFPLLGFHLAGYYWKETFVRPSLVTISSLTNISYGHETLDVGSLLLALPSEGLKQLGLFAERFHISDEPTWFSWSYTG